jgi:hypothetical protein
MRFISQEYTQKLGFSFPLQISLVRLPPRLRQQRSTCRLGRLLNSWSYHAIREKSTASNNRPPAPLGAIVQLWQCYEGSHWWMVGWSRLYSRRQPDCQQDIHDTGWGGKHKAKTLRELDFIPRHSAIANQKNYWDNQLDCYYIIWSSGMLRFLNNSYRYWAKPKRLVERSLLWWKL